MLDPARTRRLALTLVLVLLVAALGAIVVRTLPSPALHVSATVAASPTGPYFTRYVFSVVSLPDVLLTVRPGQTLNLQWSPSPDDTRLVNGPMPETCSTLLYGPFADHPAAEQAEETLNGGGGPAGTPTAEGNTLHLVLAWPALALNDFINTVQVEEVALPSSIAPGYYILDTRELDVYGSSWFDQLLTVMSPAG